MEVFTLIMKPKDGLDALKWGWIEGMAIVIEWHDTCE